MKIIKNIFALSLLFFVSCSNPVEKGATTISATPQEWMTSQGLLEGMAMEPVKSIDVEVLAKHYAEHPNRWNKVFEILRSENLEELPLGLTQINDNLKMNVQEYETRPAVCHEELLYEKHEDYIDVQCVIWGEELHGKSDVANAKIAKEYNPDFDAAMYNCEDVPFYIIGAKMFTIFFPDEVHTTNYGFGEKGNVRKIVFKVKY